jgi:hypothetical protein
MSNSHNNVVVIVLEEANYLTSKQSYKDQST